MYFLFTKKKLLFLLQPQSMMFPGLHPMAMMSTVGMGFTRGTAAPAGLFPAGAAPYAGATGGVYPAGMVPPTGSQQVGPGFHSKH